MMIDPGKMQHYKECMKEDYIIAHDVKVGKRYASDDILAFDIETCNYYVTPSGEILSIRDIFARCKYDLDEIDKMFDEVTPGAVPYIWMFGYNHRVIYGRDLPEFKTFLEYLAPKFQNETHIFVHNLSFEYQYLRELFDFDEVFLTEARNPLYCKLGNFKFRCSYRLTGLSLEKWGKEIGVQKKVGDLDYYSLYTPQQELDEKSLGYCKGDIDVMLAGLDIYREEYKHIVKIPYTITGIPRRDVKRINAKQKLSYKYADCQPKTPEAWKVQHQTFQGGLTLVNPQHCGRILHHIESEDKKSAYPFAFFKKYPCSEFIKTCAPVEWNDGNHHICLVEFQGLQARYNITPLSSSKRVMIQGAVYSNDAVLKNNGKIIYCDRCAFYLTEIDFKLIDMYYTYKKCIIHSHWFAMSDYLDKSFIKYMLKLYADKTLLKHSDPVFYQRQKGKLNSLYGLSATALCRDSIEETEDHEYIKIRMNDDQMQTELITYQEKPYKNVLPYSAGIYCTAHQRYMLMEMALKAGVDRLCYTDTDSLKGRYRKSELKIFEEENERIIKWTFDRCMEQGIEYELTCPKDDEGVPQYIGTWEHDASYYDIKFLGAKRYAYRYSKDDAVHITVAGVPKSAQRALHSLKDFKEGLKFDLFNSHKNLICYLDGDNPQVTFPDGYTVTNKYAANIRPTSYTLSLTADFRDLIKHYLAMKYH